LSSKSIVLIPKGGLCNRLRTINSVYELFAKDRIITVIWLNEPGLMAKSEALFSLPSDIHIKEIDYHSTIKYLSYKLLRRIGMILNRWILYENIVDEDDEFVLELFKKDHIICESFYEIAHKRGKDVFIPNEDIISRADKVISNNKDYIGVHIRQTDHTLAIDASPIEAFAKLIKELVDRGERIYLSTDDREVRDRFYNEYPNNIFYQKTDELSRESLEGMKAAYVDIICLSRSKKIYGSCFSSFSEYAAYIGNIPLEIVKK